MKATVLNKETTDEISFLKPWQWGTLLNSYIYIEEISDNTATSNYIT